MTLLSDKAEEEMRRTDDSFLRKIALGVVTAVVIQVLFSIYFAGTLSNQVENNTKAIEIFTDRLKAQDATIIALEKVKTLVDVMAVDRARAETRFEAIIAEQQRLALSVERMNLIQAQRK